jgi:hypothetical protein
MRVMTPIMHDTPIAGDRVETSHMVASPPLHGARRQRMSFIESRIEAPATSSLPRIAPCAELDVAFGERADGVDSRLIINGLDGWWVSPRESVWCIDIIASLQPCEAVFAHRCRMQL